MTGTMKADLLGGLQNLRCLSLALTNVLIGVKDFVPECTFEAYLNTHQKVLKALEDAETLIREDRPKTLIESDIFARIVQSIQMYQALYTVCGEGGYDKILFGIANYMYDVQDSIWNELYDNQSSYLPSKAREALDSIDEVFE